MYAGEPRAAIDELNRLVATVDGMGIPDPATMKIAALTNAATIAIHTGNIAAAEQSLKRLATVLMQQADQVGTPTFRRGQQATLAYLEGWLAARKGDYATALRTATEGAGDAAQAKRLFREVADYNFNVVGFALVQLVQKEAQQKAG